MSDLQGHLTRLAIFLNGYYEVDNEGNKYKSHFSHYHNDDIFCKLFISELEFIEHFDEYGFKKKPKRVSEEELTTYISLVNDDYFYIIYDCYHPNPEQFNLSQTFEFPHISKLLLKTFPNLLYRDALSLIKELNHHVHYGFFEMSDYYLNNVTYIFKYAKIDSLKKVLEQFKYENTL